MLRGEGESRWITGVLLLAILCTGPVHSLAQTPPKPENDAPPKPNAPAVDPDQHPFARKFPMDEFPQGLTWMNTRPLKLKNLRGKFVLLDFWTYCCINCLHILPELKKLEKQYGDQLVVIGVHSAKFDGEKDTKNITDAILRYEIEHPVINDADHKVWNSLGIRSWPTLLLIDPEGNAVWGRAGEIKAEDISEVLDRALPYYRKQKLLDETPIRFELLAYDAEPTPLRYPGKILADEKGQRLFISDSNHNRIVITDLSGKLLDAIGSGALGKEDGGYAKAAFDHPQGLALNGETLYVADTENHSLRKVDLQTKQVTTIAGTGEQARFPWPGVEELTDSLPKRWVGPPKTTALNSPWALWIHNKDLYIAMAGPHQIWKMSLDETEIGPYAGSSREDIIDGALLPEVPPQLARFFPGDPSGSAFAQPSGLTSDGQWLYVADSEGSSIRAVPFDTQKKVRTVVGTAELPGGRLFTFGDKDGPRDQVLLQHALGVAYHKGKIFVADTYNNKIKVVDAKSGDTTTLAGTGSPGRGDGAADTATFDEPAGIAFAGGRLYVADTNNHSIRVVDVSTGGVETLSVEGLLPPPPPKPDGKPSFDRAEKVQLPETTVAATDGKLQVRMDLDLPEGWKLNERAPWSCWVETQSARGPVSRAALGKKKFDKSNLQLKLNLPSESQGAETIQVSMTYYYCSEGGLCKIGSVVWVAPVKIDPDAKSKELVLPLEVKK